MKPYVKPTFEFVELRAEERLAACTSRRFKSNGHKDNCTKNKNKPFTGHGYDHGDGPGNGKALGHLGIS